MKRKKKQSNFVINKSGIKKFKLPRDEKSKYVEVGSYVIFKHGIDTMKTMEGKVHSLVDTRGVCVYTRFGIFHALWEHVTDVYVDKGSVVFEDDKKLHEKFNAAMDEIKAEAEVVEGVTVQDYHNLMDYVVRELNIKYKSKWIKVTFWDKDDLKLICTTSENKRISNIKFDENGVPNLNPTKTKINNFRKAYKKELRDQKKAEQERKRELRKMRKLEKEKAKKKRARKKKK
jgi:hypothetical protein